MPFVGAKAEVVGSKGPTPFVRASKTSGQAVVPARIKIALTLVRNSSTVSELPARQRVCACLSPALTINSHIRTMWVCVAATFGNNGQQPDSPFVSRHSVVVNGPRQIVP